MTIIREDCLRLAKDVLKACKAFGIKVTTAESCTGGMIAAFLTDVPGSSSVVDRGFVTYSNEAKQEMLGVPADIIAVNGAVSEP
ncbi:MAG: nicotinamide-nucleotide amidohydrolase family protein, partial [Rhodospirillales bacterium]